MQKISAIIQDRKEREKLYLVEGKRNIAQNNISTLLQLSLTSLILVVILLAAAKILMPTWSPAPVHIAYIPVALAYGVVAFLLRKGRANPRLISAICFSYNVVAAIFIILIDIYAHAESPACFMPIVIVALASGLYFPSKVSNIYLAAFGIVFIFADMMHKVDYEYAWRYDVFIAIVGTLVALAVGEHFRTTQVTSFETKMKYKSLSMRDPLLENIFNKRGYEDAIERYLFARNPRVNCAFIVLDLNNFKHINDNYGHDMGDNILRCMSSTLLSLFRDSDIIGRFGGDEFIVLADGLDDEDALEKKCRYISELIGRRAQETGAIKVFSSIGAVICKNQKVEFETLFELADKAMYEAKEMGRDADRFVLRHYTDASDAETAEA